LTGLTRLTILANKKAKGQQGIKMSKSD